MGPTSWARPPSWRAHTMDHHRLKGSPWRRDPTVRAERINFTPSSHKRKIFTRPPHQHDLDKYGHSLSRRSNQLFNVNVSIYYTLFLFPFASSVQKSASVMIPGRYFEPHTNFIRCFFFFCLFWYRPLSKYGLIQETCLLHILEILL